MTKKELNFTERFGKLNENGKDSKKLAEKLAVMTEYNSLENEVKKAAVENESEEDKLNELGKGAEQEANFNLIEVGEIIAEATTSKTLSTVGGFLVGLVLLPLFSFIRGGFYKNDDNLEEDKLII